MAEEIFFEYEIIKSDPGIASIKLGKNVLGGNEALAFTSKLHELADKKIKAVIVDMHDVEIINSSGLGMLVSGLSTLRKHNITLALAAVPQKVESLLEMTHLDKVFSLFGNIEAAVKEIS